MAPRRERRRRPARGARRPLRRRVLVVCEGAVTEVEYLDGLRRTLREASVQVHTIGDLSDPRGLVRRAEKERALAEDRARRRGVPALAYDEVWCVFDRDEHEHFDEAIRHARRVGLALAVSNPCFELWLLLHFQESAGARRCVEVCRALDSHRSRRGKHLDFEDFRGRIDDAIRRARRLEQEAVRRGVGEHANPSTGVHRLVETLRPGGR